MSLEQLTLPGDLECYSAIHYIELGRSSGAWRLKWLVGLEQGPARPPMTGLYSQASARYLRPKPIVVKAQD